MPRQVLDFLSSWGNSLGRGQVQQIWKQVPLCVMWGLWRKRNARHFEDVEMPVLELRRNVLNTLFVWVLARHSPSRVTFAEFLTLFIKKKNVEEYNFCFSINENNAGCDHLLV